MPPAPARARFGAELRQHRTRMRHTQDSLGKLLHVTGDAVATWERGRSLPDDTTIRRLDRVLGADGALYAAWSDAKADSTPDSPPIGLSDPAPLATLITQSAHEAAEFGAWAERCNTGETAITALHIRLRQLAADALTQPPAQIIAAAADLNRETFTLLRGHHKPAHARDLYQVAGAACALLAWLSGDLGNLQAARVHGAAARVCADHAEQGELHAWVAAVRSKTAFWARDYHAAARLAAEGLTRDAPGTVRIMLACQQADAYAMLGAAREIRAALQRAETEAAAQTGRDGIGGLFSFGPARHANYAASARLALGEHKAALMEADRALAVFDAEGGYGFGTVAQVHIARTLTYAGAGDLEAAALAARPVLDLPQPRRLATLTERLRPLARALNAPALRSSKVAAPLREEITAFCGVPGQRALAAGTGREERP